MTHKKNHPRIQISTPSMQATTTTATPPSPPPLPSPNNQSWFLFWSRLGIGRNSQERNIMTTIGSKQQQQQRRFSLDRVMMILIGFGILSLISQTHLCVQQQQQQQLPFHGEGMGMFDSTGSSSSSSIWSSLGLAGGGRGIDRRPHWDYLAGGIVAAPKPERTYLPCLQAPSFDDIIIPAKSRQQQQDDTREDEESSSSSSCHVMVHVQPQFRRRIPPKTKSKRTASLCLFIKNEPLYVNEYVDYHLGIGFDEIFVYDNSHDFNLKSWGMYKSNETHGRLILTHYPGIQQQVPAYRQCVHDSQRNNHTWMGILDTDEILILHQHDHVIDLLEEYCQTGALSIYWIVFGHSNQTRYRPYPLAQRFRYHSKIVNPHYKTIGKLSDIVDVDVHFMKVNHHCHHHRNTTTRTRTNPFDNMTLQARI